MEPLERHFGKAEEERKQIEAEGAEMTEKMKDFRDTLYGYYVYINLIWIIICSIAQVYRYNIRFLTAFLGSTDRNNLNFSTEWTINILPASEIDKIVLNPLQDFSQETLEDGSSLQSCKDLEAFLKSQNATYTEGELKKSGSARFSRY